MPRDDRRVGPRGRAAGGLAHRFRRRRPERSITASRGIVPSPALRREGDEDGAADRRARAGGLCEGIDRGVVKLAEPEVAELDRGSRVVGRGRQGAHEPCRVPHRKCGRSRRDRHAPPPRGAGGCRHARPCRSRLWPVGTRQPPQVHRQSAAATGRKRGKRPAGLRTGPRRFQPRGAGPGRACDGLECRLESPPIPRTHPWPLLPPATRGGRRSCQPAGPP